MQNKNQPNNDREENNICIKCGLCCDGTLFSRARIFEGETIDNKLEMEVIKIENKDTEGFALPCGYLKDRVCSIYYSNRPKRPLICSRFKCKLLRKYEKQEGSYEDALIIIENTKALITNFNIEIKNYFPDIASESINVKLSKLDEKHYESLNQLAFRKKYGKVLLDSFTLRTIFGKHFRKAKNM